jgi:hypothetical protein
MTTNQTLTIEEGKELLKLCRAGKLYEVEAWIGAGKPRIPRRPIGERWPTYQY